MKIKNLKEFWKKLTSSKYQLTLFERDGDGVQFEDTVYLSKISKINSNGFRGLDMNGRRIEYYTQKEFTYRIIQIY